MAWEMSNHVGAVTHEQARTCGEVFANYENWANSNSVVWRPVEWDSHSIVASHGTGDTIELLPQRRRTVITSDIKDEMKRKRSSIVEFGRRTARKVSRILSKKHKGSDDSGYQSLASPRTPQVVVVPTPDQNEVEDIRAQGPDLEDERSIATAMDNEDHTGLHLHRHRRPTPYPSSRSEASLSAISNMIDSPTDVYEANPFEVDQVEHAGHWDGRPPAYAHEAVTPPDWSQSSEDGAHMFDADRLSRSLGAAQQVGETDDGARGARFVACYGNQTSRGAQVVASDRHRENVVAKMQRASVPTEGQAGSSTWQKSSSVGSSNERLSDGFFSSPL